MDIVVEGRHFGDNHLQACTFAQGLAREYGRAVEMRALISKQVEHVETKRLATIHPDGYRRPFRKNSPPRDFAPQLEAIS